MSAAHAHQPDRFPGDQAQVRVLFARQAIIDSAGTTFGYELLYRGARSEIGEIPDQEHATCQVLAAAFADIGLTAAVGSATAWINVSERFLRDFDPLPLPPHQTVLELLEDHEPSPELIERLSELRDAGYKVALDDFVLGADNHRMLAVADIVKVDLQSASRDVIEPMIAALAVLDLTVVAEKVETQAERDWAQAAGATLFQGFFFCEPAEVEAIGEEPHAASLSRLRAAAGLADGDAGFEQVEMAVKTDPELSLQLLRYINSAAVSLPHRIGSVRQAMTLLGLRTIKQWALVLLLGGIAEQRGPLLATGIVRARTCELIAEEKGAPQPDEYFSVGLLSVCDALLGRPLADLLADLPLDVAVSGALIDRVGPMGAALESAIACERGLIPDRDAIVALAAHADAVTWTETQGLV